MGNHIEFYTEKKITSLLSFIIFKKKKNKGKIFNFTIHCLLKIIGQRLLFMMIKLKISIIKTFNLFSKQQHLFKILFFNLVFFSNKIY